MYVQYKYLIHVSIVYVSMMYTCSFDAVYDNHEQKNKNLGWSLGLNAMRCGCWKE